MKKFIVQSDRYGLIRHDFGCALIDHCDYINWYNREEIYRYFRDSRSIKDIEDNRLDTHIVALHPGITDEVKSMQDLIPIGSLEYVKNIIRIQLGLTDKSKVVIKPINVPKKLLDKKYTLRDIEEMGRDGLKFILYRNNKEYFIKSATDCKKFDAMITKSISEVPADEKYFVSEVIDIECEWRVFVHKNIVRGVKLYSGDWRDSLKTEGLAEFIDEVVTEFNSELSAYTIDIGKVGSKYCVIEAHNFISCGLYGFSYKNLPQMFESAYKDEIKRIKYIIEKGNN